MPAVPALIMAGGSAIGSIAANKARKSATQQAAQRSPEEQALFAKQGQLADQSLAQGQQAFGTGMGQLRSTIDYYRTLLDGSRAARMNAVSGETQDVAQAYQGADVAAGKNLRGGERDQAMAENSRAKAGQISRLVTGVRPGAAQALSGIGSGLVGAAQGFEGQAGNIQGNLLGNSTDNRMQANQAGDKAAERTGAAIGNITGLLAGQSWGRGGSQASTPSGWSIKGFGGRLPGASMPPEVGY